MLSRDAPTDLKGNRDAVHPSGIASKTRETASSRGAATIQTRRLRLYRGRAITLHSIIWLPMYLI
jgi:hypothetical protein